MNNKKLGTDFENEFCEKLSRMGYWVHFLNPAPDGGQPFDIVAAKDGVAYAFDCKTSVSRTFSINRLEENQKLSFELWMKRGNNIPRVAIKYRDRIYIILYTVLKKYKTVDLTGGLVECCLD